MYFPFWRERGTIRFSEWWIVDSTMLEHRKACCCTFDSYPGFPRKEAFMSAFYKGGSGIFSSIKIRMQKITKGKIAKTKLLSGEKGGLFASANGG